MPNIKSAKKRVRVSTSKAVTNKSEMTALKTAVKKANAAIDNNAADKAEVVKSACISLDQAASKGIIKKNTAANKKSKLASKLS
jgi:small subunit ribosomal protein S20